MQPESKINYSTPIAIVLAGIIIASAMYFSDGKKAVAPEVDNKANIVSIKNVKIDDEPFIGNPNAPVTMAVWFDYQCPACQYNEQNLISPLVVEYVKTGKLKIIFKDFAFLGLPQIQDSMNLALTARAVWEAYPDKFYEWHKTIFTNQGKENTGWATKAVITDLTKKVSGIDMVVIDNLLNTNLAKYKKLIEDNKNEGIKFGINATPSFIIGDTLQVGVPQYAVVKQMIDSLLK
jgi:protein-disulfide isomerase